MVMGDLNAKVGQDNYMLNHVMLIHGIGARNDNGERFVDFCSTNRLVIGGTIFQQGLPAIRLVAYRLLEILQIKSTSLPYLVGLEGG